MQLRRAFTLRAASDDAARRLDYVEEWDDADELRGQFKSERFIRLPALLGTASEPPVVEFRVVSESHALEHITNGEDFGVRRG